MSRRHSLRVVPFLVVPALLLGACSSDKPTEADMPDYVAAVKPQTQAITLSNLTLSSTTMAIGDNAADYTVTITNSKGKFTGDLTLQGYIRQTRTSDGAVVNQGAGGTSVQCSTRLNELPHGSCTQGFSINTSGQSQFGPLPEPGAATFHLELVDINGTVLDFKDASITLQ